MEKPVVSISRNSDIKAAVAECLSNIKIRDLNGKKVLLKPNVGREADPKTAINTNPDVVKAIFDFLNSKFDAKFFIGDSPIINTDSRTAFKTSGYSALLDEKDLEFIDLDSRPPITKEIPDGRVLKSIKLTGYFDKFDYVISIPVLKMHMHTGASLGFKNLKGLIYKREKIKLHHLQAPKELQEVKEKYFSESLGEVKELDIAISDLAQIIQPNLTIIDASFVQEGMGPSSGNKIKMDTIIASKNVLAADIVALKLTQPGWSLDNVPHLKLISKSLPNYPRSMDDMLTIPVDIQPFIRPIEPPPKSISIKYANVNLISDQACSACLSTVFNLLKNNKSFIDEHYTAEHPLNLAIGKGLKKSDLYDQTYLIGNCTYNQHESGIFIKGCTPVESTILKIIKENII